MTTVQRLPINWYIDKLLAKQPFVSLLYGDGEFQVMLRERTGQTLAFGEVVDRQLEDEMLASLGWIGDSIVRGTDPNLIEYDKYQGGDKTGIQILGCKIGGMLAGKDITFTDGVVWDVASREGKLNPLFQALRQRSTVIVGNVHICNALWPLLGGVKARVFIPLENAWSEIDSIEESCKMVQWPDAVYLLCCGLSAIPLAIRLHKWNPYATILDLGSIFDIFAGIGEQRGWRSELYADPIAHRKLIFKHTEGL